MHILIAEDDSFLRTVYTAELQKAGHTVTCVEDGAQVLESMRAHRPDIVLLDILMPHKDGFAVLQDLKNDASLSPIPVVVLTGLGQERDVERAKSLGAREYFMKSRTDLDQLVMHVRYMVPPDAS